MFSKSLPLAINSAAFCCVQLPTNLISTASSSRWMRTSQWPSRLPKTSSHVWPLSCRYSFNDQNRSNNMFSTSSNYNVQTSSFASLSSVAGKLERPIIEVQHFGVSKYIGLPCFRGQDALHNSFVPEWNSFRDLSFIEQVCVAPHTSVAIRFQQLIQGSWKR